MEVSSSKGREPKTVIIRAIGPELTQFGVPNVLANPTLELHNGAGALIASNDNWQTTIIGGIITHDQVQEILNSGRAPTDPRESAIIANLPAGNYTAIVRGVSSTTGVALVEVYDLSSDADSILGNISTRSFVQTGDNVMIGGFIVQGSQPKMVIIRAIGPELTPFGVPNVLANPTLELHNGAGALIASNDNWQTTIIGGIITHDQVQEILNSGRAPTRSKGICDHRKSTSRQLHSNRARCKRHHWSRSREEFTICSRIRLPANRRLSQIASVIVQCAERSNRQIIDCAS